MEGEEAAWPDWREAGDYAPLLEAERPLIAWEWLRRDPSYVAAAANGGLPPNHFGLLAFEPPGAGVPEARPLWSSDADPHVLNVHPSAPTDRRDCFDLGGMASVARLATAMSAEHLLLSDGFRSIRLDGPSGTFSIGPQALDYSISGLASAAPALLTLRRFLALLSTGRFSGILHPRERRARRWALALRAWDGLRAGACQREIAEALLSRSAADPGWRSREPSIRLQAQRLVRLAREMGAGGYRALLRKVDVIA